MVNPPSVLEVSPSSTFSLISKSVGVATSISEPVGSPIDTLELKLSVLEVSPSSTSCKLSVLEVSPSTSSSLFFIPGYFPLFTLRGGYSVCDCGLQSSRDINPLDLPREIDKPTLHLLGLQAQRMGANRRDLPADWPGQQFTHPVGQGHLPFCIVPTACVGKMAVRRNFQHWRHRPSNSASCSFRKLGLQVTAPGSQIFPPLHTAAAAFYAAIEQAFSTCFSLPFTFRRRLASSMHGHTIAPSCLLLLETSVHRLPRVP